MSLFENLYNECNCSDCKLTKFKSNYFKYINQINDETCLINFKKKLNRNNFIKKIQKENELLFRPLTIQDVNIKRKYFIKLIGILQNSEKITILLRNVECYFDIEINSINQLNNIKQIIKKEKIKQWITFSAYPLIGYKKEPKIFLRLFFNNLNDRSSLLKKMQDFQTYSDDLYNHYRKVAREYELHLTSWNIIKNYEYYNNMYYVSIDNFSYSENQLIDGKFLIFTWDIES